MKQTILAVLLILTIIYGIYIYMYVQNKQKELNLKRKNIKKQDVTEKILSNYKDTLLNIMKDVTEEDINMCDIHNEEELMEILIADITDKFMSLLLYEETEKILSIVDEDAIDIFISNTFISEYNIREIYYNNINKYKFKENNYNEELGTEQVSNHIKSDSSTIDITNDLNGIFFGGEI